MRLESDYSKVWLWLHATLDQQCDLPLCSAVPKHTDTDIGYWQKSQTKELPQRIMASNDRVMGNNDVIRMLTRSLLRKTKLCTKRGRDCFEQQPA
jgi:hypothetical protein